jgi:hypothetical protein
MSRPRADDGTPRAARSLGGQGARTDTARLPVQPALTLEPGIDPDLELDFDPATLDPYRQLCSRDEAGFGD